MNKIAMLTIFIGINLLFLAVDPIIAGIFLLMWPFWYHQHLPEISDEL